MYYVIAKNSENKKTYVSTFKEKREAVSNIAFRFKKKLNSLNSSKHDIKNVETCWDCDEIYEELLDQNYDQLSESKKVKIMYDLFNYEQETYARQDIAGKSFLQIVGLIQIYMILCWIQDINLNVIFQNQDHQII